LTSAKLPILLRDTQKGTRILTLEEKITFMEKPNQLEHLLYN